METPTAELFQCCCCKEWQPRIEAIYDGDYDDVVCQMCNEAGKDAKVYLAKAHIRPVIHSSHINGRGK